MNLNKLTQRSIDAINTAQQAAMAESHPEVTALHLLDALLKQEEGLVVQVIKRLGVDDAALVAEVNKEMISLPRQSGGQVHPSNDFTQVIYKAESELKGFGDEYVSVEHLLLAILEVKSKAQEVLRANGVKRNDVLKVLGAIRGKSRVTDDNPESKYAVLEKITTCVND